MRRNKTTKLIALLMSMTMITSVFVGNTLSRYVTSVSSTDNARVAVWGINGEDVTMELFNTQYDLDGKLIAKSNVDGEKIIAPGTGGSSAFSIINYESDTIPPEVAYDVKISLDDSEVDEKIINNTSIQWKLDNNSWGSFDELKSSLLSLVGDPSGLKTFAPGEFATAFKGDVEHNISWQWVMDGNNEVDTQMGNDALTSDIGVKITVSITAEQSDGSSVGMLDGANQIININDLQPAVFRSVAPMNELVEVQVNNETVDPSNYTVEEGSTIIKFAIDYLRTLIKGTYTINIVSQNMTATAKFYVSDGPIVHNGVIPQGGTYYVKGTVDTTSSQNASPVGDYSVAIDILNAGDNFPEPQIGDVYVYGDYEYRYGFEYWNLGKWLKNTQLNGWAPRVLNVDKTEYSQLLTTIAGVNITSLHSTFASSEIMVPPIIPETVEAMTLTFYNCCNLETAPVIPSSVRSLEKTYYDCYNLKEVPDIPYGVVNMVSTFSGCTSLEVSPRIPDSVINMDSTFFGCNSLKEVKNIPNNVTNLSWTFYNCNKLITVPTIPESVIDLSTAFTRCKSLTGEIKINANPKYYEDAFSERNKEIILVGNSTKLNEIAATGTNVKVANYNDGTNQLYVSETLSENSWETISTVAKSGKAAEYWSVGDATTVDVNGTDYEVVIAGIDHDGDNTITFVFNENVTSAVMNDDLSNLGSWKESKMRTVTIPEILAQMENKDLIKEVEKKTIKGAGDGDIVASYDLITTNDKLFLLSYTEVLGNDYLPSAVDDFNEGTQYEYFKNAENRLIKSRENEEPVLWWLRSPSETSLYLFFCINPIDDYKFQDPDHMGAVVPAFVIG